MILRALALWPSFARVTCAENLFTVCTSCAAARACNPSLFLISSFLTTLAMMSLVDVAVFYVDAIFSLGEPFLQLLHQRHGAMPPAGTAQGEGQAAFALALVK